MRLAVRGVPKGAFRTHSAQQAPLWGSLVTCVRVNPRSYFVHGDGIRTLDWFAA